MEGRGESAVKRLIGCWIVVSMPEEGLDEALTSLKDIFEFSYEDTRLALPEAATRRSLTGRATISSRRPDLVVSE